MAEQPSGERESAEVNPELPNRESFNFLGKKTFYFSRGVQAGKLCECRAPTEHLPSTYRAHEEVPKSFVPTLGR